MRGGGGTVCVSPFYGQCRVVRCCRAAWRSCARGWASRCPAPRRAFQQLSTKASSCSKQTASAGTQLCIGSAPATTPGRPSRIFGQRCSAASAPSTRRRWLQQLCFFGPSGCLTPRSPQTSSAASVTMAAALWVCAPAHTGSAVLAKPLELGKDGIGSSSGDSSGVSTEGAGGIRVVFFLLLYCCAHVCVNTIPCFLNTCVPCELYVFYLRANNRQTRTCTRPERSGARRAHLSRG